MQTTGAAWHAGIARQIITPFPGVELAGLGYYLNRTWDRVNDDLHASALVIVDENGRGAAFLALDVLYTDEATVLAIREQAAARTDLRPDAICVNCSHSHNAPTLALFDGAGEMDPEYNKLVIARSVDALEAAWKSRVPARLRVGSSTLSGFSYNRTREGGPVDERVSVLRADTLAGQPLAVAVNFHTHPTVFWSVEPRSVSRDWPGHVVDLIEEALPGAMALYLQGTCGDSQPLQEYWTRERYREAGQIVFESAMKAMAASREIQAAGLQTVARAAQLPVRKWTREEVLAFYEEGKYRLETGDKEGWLDGIAARMVGFPHRLHERYGGSVDKAVEAVSRFAVRWGEHVLLRLDAQSESRQTEFWAARIGDAWFVSNAAEFFSTLALEIRRDWPGDDLFILGYSNGSISYPAGRLRSGPGQLCFEKKKNNPKKDKKHPKPNPQNQKQQKQKSSLLRTDLRLQSGGSFGGNRLTGLELSKRESENRSDYNLLGGQGDFERIENALLLLVGHGQLCNSYLVVHFVMEQGEAAQRGQGIGDSDGVAVSVGGAKDSGQPALHFALEFQSKHGAEDMSARA